MAGGELAGSRFLLGLKALDGTDGYGAQAVFERVFREAGLPKGMLTDNGSPFAAARGRFGLTQLTVWWIQRGIQPVRIEPGHPEQNGARERMHRTLKAETGQPPAGSKSAQQHRFNRLREVYNTERQHEALRQVPPLRDGTLHRGVGLDEIDDGIWSVYFCAFPLGRYDERDRKMQT